MSASERSNAVETSLTQDLVSAGRDYIGRGRGLLILATVVVTAGVATMFTMENANQIPNFKGGKQNA